VPARLGDSDVELEHVGAATATLGLAVGRLTELVENMRGLAINHVVSVEMLVLDASGGAERSTSVPVAAVTVANYGAAVATIAAGGRQTSAPAMGIGQFDVGAARMATIPLAGTVFTVYGAPAARVGLVLWTRPQPPACGPIA
jgi:hypothetical protein